LVKKKNIIPSSLDSALRELAGKFIAVELENGDLVEGVITKVRNRRAHISYPSSYGVKESVLPIDGIKSVRLLELR
jgi:hypothetical protein